MLTVVGLGNPGSSYAKTRHNIGFMLLDNILQDGILDKFSYSDKNPDSLPWIFDSKAKFKKSSGSFFITEGMLGTIKFCLVKPTTFMNESGRVITSLKSRGIFSELPEILVVVDDVDLDIGRIRLRQKGSAGGHNGLKSIIRHLGTDEFSRLRIGVGPRPGGDEMVDHVLGTFTHEEFKIIKSSLYKSAQVVRAWIANGYGEALNVLSEL
ncbi:MAG: aminoacyl-tRNA hydrolase [Candidatus Latescibacteria bacterium]|nr:aminoacyl-tRNA hydrolase [Candidatus Latescibacterota bacterium]